VAAKQTAASLDLRPLKTSYVDVDRMTLDRPEIGRSPAASGAAPVVADEVDLVAKAVTSYLRRMQDAGRIVLRLGEDGVELRLDTHDRAA
jgi:hypothetical protein